MHKTNLQLKAFYKVNALYYHHPSQEIGHSLYPDSLSLVLFQLWLFPFLPKNVHCHDFLQETSNRLDLELTRLNMNLINICIVLCLDSFSTFVRFYIFVLVIVSTLLLNMLSHCRNIVWFDFSLYYLLMNTLVVPYSQ